MKKNGIIFMLTLTVIAVLAFASIASSEEVATYIARYPAPANWPMIILNELPSYNPNSTAGWQVDLRRRDLSQLNITDRLDDLLYADFDTRTVWPTALPEGFDPAAIMAQALGPGFNVRDLHKEGITGKGVGIAILDQTLLVDHMEYKDNLRFYDEIQLPASSASMHGAAVSSIAVGKNVGVAPEADLYYLAVKLGEYENDSYIYDYSWLAMSIQRILDLNHTLPTDRKIRVIAICLGFDAMTQGYEELMAAFDRAKQENVFIVSSSLVETYGMGFHGLGRNPLKNPNEFSSYGPGLWWASGFYAGRIDTYKEYYGLEELLLFPMDAKTTASPTGVDHYVYYRQGGWSWVIPYIAGVYALACQVKPDMTPKLFWEMGLKTAETTTLEKGGTKYKFGKIINPVNQESSANAIKAEKVKENVKKAVGEESSTAFFGSGERITGLTRFHVPYELHPHESPTRVLPSPLHGWWGYK